MVLDDSLWCQHDTDDENSISIHVFAHTCINSNVPIVLKIINATRKLWFLVGDLYIFGTIQWKGAILGGLD